MSIIVLHEYRMSLINGRQKCLKYWSGGLDRSGHNHFDILWTKMFSSKRIGRHRFSSAAADLSNQKAFLYSYERTFVAPAPYCLQQRRGRRASAGGGPCSGIWSYLICTHNRRRRRCTAAVTDTTHHPHPIGPDEIIGHGVCIREVKGKIVLLMLLLSSLFDYIYNNNNNITILVHRFCKDTVGAPFHYQYYC